ncbi:hypothetical protein NMG60_11013153 [Bertholletia excelsa]
MVKAQETQPLFHNFSPIHEHQGADIDDGYETAACGCFWRFCFPRRQGGGDGDTWVESKLKKLKEFSEVIAGPKWKNFIRKCGKYFRRNKKRNRFGYDADSYALNFDEGIGEEDDGLLPGSSSRFAAVPTSGDERRAGR